MFPSTITLPNLRVGDPVRHEALSVFPLFAETHRAIEYRLSDEAMADQSIVVEEISEGGSVPDLLVENKGGVRVLFLEGEELVGAKQNRVLNTSVLVPANSKIMIPVSCVEQGRWGYNSRYFGSSGAHSPSSLRRALKKSVSHSVKSKQGYRSDQGAVWSEVASLHSSHGVSSPTAAMSDAFEGYQDRLASYRESVQYVPGAVGAAVAIADRVVSIDVFDKPATCQKVWNRLLSGAVLDAMAAAAPEKSASVADVEGLLAGMKSLRWEPSDPVGEGVDYRAESKQGDHASALAFDETVVHGSVLAGVS